MRLHYGVGQSNAEHKDNPVPFKWIDECGDMTTVSDILGQV
jgi:hypothetical protein